MNRGFIDIHCHVLPGIDDGPSSTEESLKMLETARTDGIDAVVATPHIMKGVHENGREAIEKAVSELASSVDAPKLYAGADIRISRDLVQGILSAELPMINGGRYFLMELPAFGFPPVAGLQHMLQSLGNNSITPIITHPERNYAFLGNMDLMESLIRYGALFQVTAMSITGGFGRRIKRATLMMIKRGFVHVVASDAHGVDKRPPVLSDAYESVRRQFGAREAERLFKSNPLRIIRGEPINMATE